MTEQQIQKKITNYLEANGCYIVKVISASKAGVPDILGCYEGVFFGIEVKTPKTKNNVSKLQEYNLDMIRRAGGQATVAWELEHVEDFLNGLLI